MKHHRIIRYRQIMHEAIKKHAGLSDFDDEAVTKEVNAIMKALIRNGYIIRRAS